jgi:hypothetical protein
VFTLIESGARLNFESLHARLEEAEQNMLAQAVLTGDGEISAEDIGAALESMRRSGVRHEREQLKVRIKESERAGKWEEALRLMAELEGIERAARGV